MTAELQVVPARRGRAVRLTKGQAIRIINTHGQQVGDTWCINADDLSEFMSMEHLHASLQGIFPDKGQRSCDKPAAADPDAGRRYLAGPP